MGMVIQKLAKVETTKLSDNSKAYNVLVECDGGSMQIACLDKDSAARLADLINDVGCWTEFHAS